MSNKKAIRVNTNVFDEQHKKNIRKQLNKVKKIFDKAAEMGVRIGVNSKFTDPKKPFYFAEFPEANKDIDKLMHDVSKNLRAVIEQGERQEWLLSNAKNDNLINSIYTSSKLKKKQLKQFMGQNLSGLQAFQNRKLGGMNLSTRVWRLTKQFKQDLELSLDIGLGEGKSAAELSRDVRKNLQEPNRLFRKVRDKHGQLRLSKAAEAYHSGRGVYRSSYKNALRLTATETNMAYRRADYERWQQIPFVVGMKIEVPKHNHVYDICDDLAGDYPKDFVWLGWHPFCKCSASAIMADDKEFEDYNKRMLAGEDVSGYTFKSAEKYKDVPPCFSKWVKENKAKIETAKSQPYFIKDNKSIVDNLLDRTKTSKNVSSLQELGTKTNENAPNSQDLGTNDKDIKTRKKERTQAEIDKIKDAWRLRALERDLPPTLSKKERKAIAKNNLEIEKILGKKKGRRMGLSVADKQSANPNYVPKFLPHEEGCYADKHGKRFMLNPDYVENNGYDKNCQTCVPTFLLRTRGFDVTAKPKTKGSLLEKLSYQSDDVFRNIDGSKIAGNKIADFLKKHKYENMSKERYIEYFEESCPDEGLYLLRIWWEARGAHATILYRAKSGKLHYLEPQVYKKKMLRSIEDLAVRGYIKGADLLEGNLKIIRIDNKIINTDYIDIFD